jgi:hypothetical protein
LAASAGYLAFCMSWSVTLRLFEPDLLGDHGGLVRNVGADLAAGVGGALFGVLFVIGAVFWIGATLWGRIQLVVLGRIGQSWWLPSGLVGLPIGAAAGYLFHIGVLMGSESRPWAGPVLSGCIAGILAGIVLVAPRERPSRPRTP